MHEYNFYFIFIFLMLAVSFRDARLGTDFLGSANTPEALEMKMPKETLIHVYALPNFKSS